MSSLVLTWWMPNWQTKTKYSAIRSSSPTLMERSQIPLVKVRQYNWFPWFLIVTGNLCACRDVEKIQSTVIRIRTSIHSMRRGCKFLFLLDWKESHLTIITDCHCVRQCNPKCRFLEWKPVAYSGQWFNYSNQWNFNSHVRKLHKVCDNFVIELCYDDGKWNTFL